MAKILIVEDDAANRYMLMRWLSREGYETVAAPDGAQAVALSCSEHPDLILMDMGLPILNGWQATQHIKTTPDTMTIPVIALTAYTQDEDRVRCFSVGCDEFETKPVNFPRLLAKIRTFLRENGS